MKKTNIRLLSRQIFCGIFAIALLLAYYPNIANAAQITGRTLAIGNSSASVSTTYLFTFKVPQSTVIKSASFTACTTASGICTTPAGFLVTSATLTSQPTNLGDSSGWTINTATAGSLRLSNSSNVTSPTGNQTVSFSDVVNPNISNSTFFVRITTYSDASWSTPIDAGTVATSTAGQITVSAVIDELLTFTLANASVILTTPTTTTTGTGTSSMTISTNATSGYSISYSGTTLTSGSNTITPMSTQTTSTTNSKQFGINLMSNTTPVVGSNVSGAGIGVPAVGYGTADQFKFNTAGDTIASAGLPTNDNTFTTSYIVNMNGSTAAGAYSSILTYIATANF